MAKAYRIGYPEETTAWKVMEFEYTELGNEQTHDDLAIFLGMIKQSDWPTTLAEFRRRYGDAQGIWLCKTRADALLWYGKYYGEGAAILEYEYDPRNVVIELGADGTFVLDPKFIKEGWADPLYLLKKDLARILRVRKAVKPPMPEVVARLKEGAYLEGMLFFGSHSIHRLRFAEKDAPIRKTMPAAQNRYNELRTAEGLEPVTDWTKRPDRTLEQILRRAPGV